MAENRAARELERLINARAEPVQSMQNVQSLERTRERIDQEAIAAASEGREAGFSFPEGIVTGIGAGWILGPVGGLALGVAQGILGRETKQNALDQFAAEQEVIGDVNGILNNEFNRLAARATNDDDLAQLSTLQTQKDAAMKLMLSASPRMQEQGASMLADVQSELSEYTIRQESERIAAEALDAELQRELEQEQYDRFTGLKVRFDDDSQSYEDILGATNTAIEALNDGSPADLWAAGILVNKALDPTGVVRQEEAEAVGRLGSLWTKAEVILEKSLNGKSILPDERRDLQNLLGTIQEGAKEIQLAREARYLTELEDANVPQRYWDNFRLVQSVPAAEARPISETSLLDAAVDESSSALEAAQLATTDAIEAGVEGARSINQQANDRLQRIREWLRPTMPQGSPRPRRRRLPTN